MGAGQLARARRPNSDEPTSENDGGNHESKDCRSGQWRSLDRRRRRRATVLEIRPMRSARRFHAGAPLASRTDAQPVRSTDDELPGSPTTPASRCSLLLRHPHVCLQVHTVRPCCPGFFSPLYFCRPGQIEARRLYVSRR